MGARTLAARGQVGSVSRWHGTDQDKVDEARRDLAEAKLADYIEKVVHAAPPLREEQRARLTLLLRGTA